MILQCNKRAKYQAVTTSLLIFMTYETLLTVGLYPTKVRDWINNLLLYHSRLYQQSYTIMLPLHNIFLNQYWVTKTWKYLCLLYFL